TRKNPWMDFSILICITGAMDGGLATRRFALQISDTKKIHGGIFFVVRPIGRVAKPDRRRRAGAAA
ncbi:MAG: hypothetical protein II103_09670, partial [Treponema sp.]|nr:hypothetical protein [Treponema sp.]